MNLSVLYRGKLTSCNYGCVYCPFAKRMESDARLAEDRVGLLQFERWICEQSMHRWRILFTPWGEALVRSWYRDTVSRLTHCEHIESVAAQTNLSCGLEWLSDCHRSKLALWVTFHPTEIKRSVFVRKVRRIQEAGVRLSVGMVGVPEFFPEIAALRQDLPPNIYLWINAQQPRARSYTEEEIEFLNSIDPHFIKTSRPQPSMEKPCRTGHTSFTVDGEGAIRRCHFVDEVIGSIHQSDWESRLFPRLCPNRACHCYLGLAHFALLELDNVFGDTLLERIPVQWADDVALAPASRR